MFVMKKLVVGSLQDILFGLIELFDKLIMLLNSQMTDVELVLSPACGTKAMNMVEIVAMSTSSSKLKGNLLRCA